MNKLLTIAEAAEVLHVSASTVRGLCKKRKIRHERHGVGRGAIRIPDDAIAEYRMGATVPPGELPKTPQPKPRRLRNLSLD